MTTYLFVAEGTSFDLGFLHNVVDYIVDDKWNHFSLTKRLCYELYWRFILRKPFSKVCYNFDKFKYDTSENGDLIYLGNIFRREETLPKLLKLEFKLDQNLFEAFDLSPELYKIRRKKVTQEEIKNKDYEYDDLKLSIMADLIPKDIKSICDIGCGERRLKKYLSESISYIGIDYIQKADDIINID